MKLMALKDDDIVCFCFHVPLRKIENFCRIQKPRAASQISDCLSAGTGCGWCIPMIRKIHAQSCGEYKPFWRREDEESYHSAERDANVAQIDAERYAEGRKTYLKATGRKGLEKEQGEGG